MTPDRLFAILTDIDPDAAITPNGVEITIEDIPVLVVMAPGADRMRALVPIASVEDVSAEEMNRMMQANFDTALDARYAVAQGRGWGGFIHPLGADCEPRADLWHAVFRRGAGVRGRRFK